MSSVQPVVASGPMLIASTFAVAAAWIDFRQRRIPNRLVLAGLLVVLLSQIMTSGATGWWTALAGVALGLLLMLPFYVVGAMGAGDVKLMAMVGAGLGPVGVLSAAVLTFVIGAVLALVVATANGTLVHMLSNVRAMLFGAFGTLVIQRKAELVAPAVSAGRLPYGIAIALGTIAYILLLQSGIRVI